MYRYTLSNDVYGSVTFTQDPQGWEESEQSIVRSPRFHGMNYSQLVSLKFICGAGKEFIDEVYNNIGIDSEIRILIELACDCAPVVANASYSDDYNDDYEHGGVTLDCDWRNFFEGILNTKELAIEEQTTTAPLIEQGLNQKFTSRLDTKINLFGTETLDGETFTNIPEPYVLDMHSKASNTQALFGMLSNITEEISGSLWGPGLFIVPQMFLESSEGDGFLGTDLPMLITGDQAEGGLLDPLYTNTSDVIETVTVNINADFILRGLLNIFPEDNFPVTFQLITGINPVNSHIDYDLVPSQTLPFGVIPDSGGDVWVQDIPYICDYTVTLDLEPTGHIWIAVLLGATGGSWSWAFVDGGMMDVRISTASLAEPSTAKAQVIYETLAKVCQGVLSTADPVRSSYYGRIGAVPYEEPENGCGAFAAITGGYLIRQYPESYGLNTSINELFTSLDAIDNIGIGFELIENDWKLRWERKDYFYQDHEIIAFEHVPNIVRTVAQDLIYNDINIGFNKWATNDQNGLDEYCAKSQYTLALKSVSNSLDKISPIIASAYIIEQIRRMPYDSFLTTDTDYDSDVFIIALNRGLGYDGTPNDLDTAEKDENFEDVDNVLSPETAYNLRYTTSKNLLRNIPSISPVIAKESGRLIKFTSGEGNVFIITDDNVQCPSYYNGEPLAGNDSIVWDESGEQPLYIPEYLAFDFPITLTQFDQIKDALQNPENDSINGYITISNEEETFKGYIIEMKYRQLTGLSSFKLVRKYGN